MRDDASGGGDVRTHPHRPVSGRDCGTTVAVRADGGRAGDRAAPPRDDRPTKPWLNLGCGEDHIEHAVNVDIDASVNPDVVVDLQATPWPWADNAFEQVFASHILEHLDPVPWGELRRVLADDGVLILRYPIGFTRFQDATHTQFWGVDTAKWIVGETDHSHEAPFPDADLVVREVDWTIRPPSLLKSLRTHYYELVFGPGDWMNQVTGLSGEVKAVIER